jgi:predicted metal-dependent hydrolase
MNKKQLTVENIGTVTITKNRQATRFKISVQPNGTTRVTIPWQATFLNGEKFLHEHLQWILQAKQKMAAKLRPPRLIQPGHLFSTRNYHYEVSLGEGSKLKIRYAEREKKIFFEIPDSHDIGDEDLQTQLKLAIENVLRFDAKQYLPKRITELAAKLGYTFKNVTIKNNKTNWGSCSNRKNINLNLHLMRLDDKLIDYVIVHELVHTNIPNHGPNFKAMMLKHFPDTNELEKQLKKIKTDLV